jgi:hypothetical protein
MSLQAGGNHTHTRIHAELEQYRPDELFMLGPIYTTLHHVFCILLFALTCSRIHSCNAYLVCVLSFALPALHTQVQHYILPAAVCSHLLKDSVLQGLRIISRATPPDIQIYPLFDVWTRCTNNPSNPAGTHKSESLNDKCCLPSPAQESSPARLLHHSTSARKEAA